jgi:putative NIF3 family GTP cyclohydrolase 1 type 2
LNYSEKWDNVGLLIQPSKELIVKKILLTNDLTERVMQEAIESKSSVSGKYGGEFFQIDSGFLY